MSCVPPLAASLTQAVTVSVLKLSKAVELASET